MNVVLTIDTTNTDITQVALVVDGVRHEKSSSSRIHKSQAVLPLMESLLSDSGLKASDISAIEVHTGPGSFTGIRVGLSIANVLGTLLHIPINGKTTLAMPQY